MAFLSMKNSLIEILYFLIFEPQIENTLKTDSLEMLYQHSQIRPFHL